MKPVNSTKTLKKGSIMKEKGCGRIWRWMAVILSVVMAASSLAPVAVAANEMDKTVLRVAFPEVEGYTFLSENGKRVGVVVDFLNEIAKYTGWEYEYVPTSDTMDDFQNGKFDLMGGTFYVEGLEKEFAYPDYNCGYTKTRLLAKKSDPTVRSYDLSSFNGKTIGVYDRSSENIRCLKDWLLVQGLDCNIRYYSHEDLSAGNNLYARLENEEVDLLLGYGTGMPDDLYVAAAFGAQAHYIVTSQENQEVLDGLNMALEKIYASDPNFAEKEYKKNFGDDITGYAVMSPEEQDYVAEKGTVSVAVPAYWHPMYCVGVDDYHDGFVPDVLKKVEEFSGLTFTYITCDSYIDALTLVQEGGADILGFFMDTDEVAAEYGLARTASYVSVSPILVRNKNVNYPSEGKVCGGLSGRKIPEFITADEFVYYDSPRDGLKAVNQGDIDYYYGMSAHAENIIRQDNLFNVVQVSLSGNSTDVSFAMPGPVHSELLSILNKAINNMTEAEKEQINNLNMISIGDTQITLSGIVVSNPRLAISVAIVVLLLIMLSVILFFYFNLRSAKMKLGLEKAEADSRAKSDFLSRMSHEIRTPMNAIVGLADLTEQIPALPEKVQVNLSKIKSSSHYLLSLINDILDMSRIESGKMELNCAPFSIDVMLCDIESMLATDAQRRGLHFQVESDLRGEVYFGDNIRLRQVILNLLSNALKFTPDGGTVRLSINGKAETETERTFTVEVSDNGVGISSEDQERIFRSFEQVGSTSSKSQGTGLGLPISRSIVQLMGGTLHLKSEPGKGSTFYFTITLPKGTLHDIQEKIPVGDQSLSGISILLAEDNDLNAEIAIELLQSQGAVVQRAANGRQALNLFQNKEPNTFQAILMDIQMPEMNGLEATSALRALNRPDAKTIPIIAMTANTFMEDVDRAMEAGMTAFVPKPIDVEILYNELHAAIQKNGKSTP